MKTKVKLADWRKKQKSPSEKSNGRVHGFFTQASKSESKDSKNASGRAHDWVTDHQYLARVPHVPNSPTYHTAARGLPYLDKSAPADLQGVFAIPLEMIRESAENERQIYDPDDLAGLANSMREEGLTDANCINDEIAQVYRLKNGTYELISGHRRFRALKSLKARCIKAEIKREPNDKTELRKKRLLLNLQRVDLSPIEEAAGWKQLLADGCYSSTEAMAADVGMKHRSRSIRDLIEMDSRITLPVRKALQTGKIYKSHAIAIARKESTMQLKYLNMCFDDDGELISEKRLLALIAAAERQAPESTRLAYAYSTPSQPSKPAVDGVHVIPPPARSLAGEEARRLERESQNTAERDAKIAAVKSARSSMRAKIDSILNEWESTERKTKEGLPVNVLQACVLEFIASGYGSAHDALRERFGFEPSDPLRGIVDDRDTKDRRRVLELSRHELNSALLASVSVRNLHAKGVVA